MYFLFGSVHKAKGFPLKKSRIQAPPARTERTVQIGCQQGRFMHPNTWECHIQAPAASGISAGFGMLSDFIYPPPSGTASSNAFFLSEQPVLRMFTILEINKASECIR